jgi:hypothetical protein
LAQLLLAEFEVGQAGAEGQALLMGQEEAEAKAEPKAEQGRPAPLGSQLALAAVEASGQVGRFWFAGFRPL